MIDDFKYCPCADNIQKKDFLVGYITLNNSSFCFDFKIDYI